MKILNRKNSYLLVFQKLLTTTLNQEIFEQDHNLLNDREFEEFGEASFLWKYDNFYSLHKIFAISKGWGNVLLKLW